jgi:hypothetical protein
MNLNNLVPTRLLEVLNLIPADQAERQTARAFEAGYYDGLNGNDEPPAGDLKSFGYRRSTSPGLRDFTKMTHEQLINIAWVLYQSNPLAKRYYEIIRDHILGRGVQFQIEDEALQELVDVFCERNEFHARLEKFTIQLFLFGEQCFPVFVRASDGRVTLGYIDPGSIEQVVTHPDNVLEPYAVVLKTDVQGGKKVYRIIRKDEGHIQGSKVITPRHEGQWVLWEQAQLEPWEKALLKQCGLKAYTGSCFYFSVNNVSNQPRGFSDLLQSADWMDADDETLFALADREQMAGYFSWMVKLIGTAYDELKQKASEIRKRIPRKGQVLVTNDKEEWSMQAPDLKQQASIATSEALTDRAWGVGLGMPRTWRGIGEGSNYASAKVMGEPTRRTLENKQDIIKNMILRITEFVKDQATIAGAYSGDGEIDLTMPEMVKSDLQEISGTLSQLGQALSVYVQDLRLITKETAAKAVAKVMAEIGVEYDAVEELEKAQAEAEENEEDDLATANAANQFLAQQMKMKQMNGKGPMMPDEEDEQ